MSILVDYVREPDADCAPTALHALSLIDSEAARREAAALLAGPRAAGLPAGEREVLQTYASGK